MRRTLVIMVKEPRAGWVKTRLAREIGSVAATWWFRHQVRDLLRRLRDPRWQIVLAVSPYRRSSVWPADLVQVPQGQDDLGARMGRQLRGAAKGPVCVIGADIPDVTPACIAQAFAVLQGADAVFGPAFDGGYWLIGLKRIRAVPPRLFAGVRWSTEHALADTIATLPDHRIVYADRLRDVDTLADLSMTSRFGRDSRVT